MSQPLLQLRGVHKRPDGVTPLNGTARTVCPSASKCLRDEGGVDNAPDTAQ